MNNQSVRIMGLMGQVRRVERANAKVTLDRKIYIKDISVDMDLPVYRLPDHNGVYIGFNPPKPQNFGYGVRHG